MANIFRDQQNILYVCLGDSWGTRERMALKDCLIAKETGHNVFLYCLKDSIINLKAKERAIDCLYHSGGLSLNFLKWHRLNDFVQNLSKFDIRLVHCYDLSFLFPASFYLKRRIQIPLVFTFNHEIEKFYKRFWHKSLIRRIDQILLPIKEMADGVHGHLDVPIRKFEYTGLGVCEYLKKSSEHKSSGSWFIGCAVGGHEKKIDFLRPIISAVNSLNIKGTLNKKVKLLIYSEKKWEKFLLHKPTKDLIKSLNGNDHIFLEYTDSLVESCLKVDAWVGLDVREPIEDLLLNSILNDTPSIAPRTYATMELFRKRGSLGETYKSGDAREMREKIEKIFKNYKFYCQTITDQKSELIAEFGIEFYKKQLLKAYEKILTKRERLASKRSFKSL
ncbi:hypothetical protein A9Q84_04145 [Halobacteriovorax marinus]|uniref:Glycosyltransferase subfamily 4-like N-terminal domain-containing protein n=1 Tax=Halobacteriovorax marinus TaxID=97084 RepID=A0A1Y5FEK1_9BACT|nr:hypothetical protein A9Q84_04145 [Halobacteriovorax marinus]